jgi:membrane-associated protein
VTTDLASLALSWILSYGAPMVSGLLLLAGLGVPLPATLLVIACGAFINQDLLDLNSALMMGLGGTVIGDLLLFAVGMSASAALERRFGATAGWKNARALFEKRGWIAIFLTRWLLTAVAFPTTLIAGSSRYRFWNFALFDLLGELTWIVLYGGLGYAFGSQWELVSEFISDFSGFLLGGLAVGAGIYLIVQYQKKQTRKAEPTRG